ncbi:uncharacterized protein LOC8272549 [Ricinus communis]|uniref:Uncharacterized protein n=1 Tax=Ricinus communis TaxID=3988 RepID=B9RK68_RICCO|nr:uncharacterized protein LOC8272549 [Ricinus communis]EEF48066.1 hypothetical protein RCOM_1046930 [Ricinus communis]|eukprot:XP_002514112.1 uncharacterized protein LOC8272549 [Ricinus communis]
MEGSSSRKREGCGGRGDDDDDDDDPVVMKRPRTPPAVYSDNNMCSEEDIIMGSWLSVDQQDDYSTVDELLKFLDDNITTNTTVKFIENPYSSPLVFQSCSSYITINGNEETCGSSFSDWESSVMASVDMCGGFTKGGKMDCIDGFELSDWFRGGEGGACGFKGAEKAAREGSSGGDTNGFDWEFDYECFLDNGGSEGIF